MSRRCSHCDKLTNSVMEVCGECWAAGHRAVERCEACVAETEAIVKRLRRIIEGEPATPAAGVAP